MKLAISLFAAAAIWLLAVPFGHAYFTHNEYLAKGTQSHLVQFELNKLTEIIVAQGQMEERAIDLNYFDHVYLNPGFKLVHDPSLGQTSYLEGPADALDLVTYQGGYQNNRLGLNFQKAIRLKEPVVLRTNLNEHNVGELTINFYFQGEDRAVENFMAMGPIEGYDLVFDGHLISKQPIELEAKNAVFQLSSCKDCTVAIPPLVLTGTVERISLPKRLDRVNMQQLKADKYQVYHESMQGRRMEYLGIPALELAYDSPYSYDRSGNETVLRPDTIVVSPGSVVRAVYMNGKDSEPLDEIVVIER